MAASSALQPPGQLGAALGEEIGKLRQFIDLLQHEQALLTRGDTEALLPLIEQKNGLASALGAYAQMRENELARLGLPAGRAGMEAWLARCGENAPRGDWQALLALAGQARDINAANGKLIGLHMQHNQQAFNALMGAAGRAMTYGPDGQQQIGGGGRTLGSA